MKLTNFQRIILIASLLCLFAIVALFLGRNAIRDTIRDIRAERLFAKAQVAFEEERWDVATRQGQAAHYLAPEDKAIQLLMARATLKERNFSTLSWWKMVITEPDLPVEELKLLTVILLRSGNTEDALAFLNRLVASAPDDPETQQLWLQLLDLQKRYGQARQFASQVIRSGTEDWGIHRFYMSLESELTGSQGKQQVIGHLKELIADGGGLALNAARELATQSSAESEERLLAANYLSENSDDKFDILLARSVEVNEGAASRSDLDPLLQDILQEPEEGDLGELLNWSRFMRSPEWFLDNVSLPEFVANGGLRPTYLRLLISNGRFQELLTITEAELEDTESGMSPILMYYRASALENLGQSEAAERAMVLALQVVEPDNSFQFEQSLIRDNRWPLLVQLYESILQGNPENSVVQFKLLAASYYIGDQEKVSGTLQGVDPSQFDNNPSQASFVCYVQLVLQGPDPQLHERIESLLTEYPQISDFRPVLGLSYLLQGNAEAAEQFRADIPVLDMGMPRFIRVACILLGQDRDSYLLPGEIEFLLPRERYLLSRYSGESNQ